MAQVLKDDIRANILKAALQEFYLNGYKAAAMRRIAEHAKIPTGLIYSYYKNKEDLFDAVLKPVLYDWERVVTTGEHNNHEPQRNGAIDKLSKAEIECLSNLFDHRQEFVIMMDKSGGTKYEYERERMIQEIEKHLYAHKNEGTDEVFTHIIANNFVDGLMQVMYHYKGKDWAIMLLSKLSNMYLSGIGQ